MSNKEGKRLEKIEGVFTKDKPKLFTTKLTIDRTESDQTMLGFRSSLTDSALVNIASLPKGIQEYLMRPMWSEDGSEYSLGRVPMGGTDFSLRGYTYQDEINGTFSL